MLIILPYFPVKPKFPMSDVGKNFFTRQALSKGTDFSKLEKS